MLNSCAVSDCAPLVLHMQIVGFLMRGSFKLNCSSVWCVCGACFFVVQADCRFAPCSVTKICPCITQRMLSTLKIENFQQKIFDIFLIFAQNIDCGYTLEGSNKYPQSMFWIKNKKNRYTPAYPHPSFAI